MADNKVATRQELEDMGYVTTGDLTPTENFYLSKDGTHSITMSTTSPPT